MTLVDQIVGQPGNFEIQHIICAEQASTSSPHRSLRQELEKHRAAFLDWRNIRASPRHPREPRNWPGYTQHAEDDEKGAPTVSCHEHPAEKCPQGWATPDSSGDERVGEPPADFRNVPY